MDNIPHSERSQPVSTAEIIPLTQASLGGEHVPAVDGRELHGKLGIRRDYTTWMRHQIRRAQLVEGQDYLLTTKGEKLPSGTKNRSEYVLSLDAAKHIAMMSGSDSGAEIRRYFIEVEKRFRALSPPAPVALGNPAVLRALLLGYVDQVQASQAALEAMTPKADFHDAIAEAKDAQTIQAAAKALGFGPNRFFKLLRDKRVLMENNLPYQAHLDAGRFRVVERTFEDRNGIHIHARTLVTGKGLIYLQQLTKKEAA